MRDRLGVNLKRTTSRLCEVVLRVLLFHRAFGKMFTELFKITARLVNNLSDAPSAQDNLSKLLTALSTKRRHPLDLCTFLARGSALGGEGGEQL